MSSHFGALYKSNLGRNTPATPFSLALVELQKQCSDGLFNQGAPGQYSPDVAQALANLGTDTGTWFPLWSKTVSASRCSWAPSDQSKLSCLQVPLCRTFEWSHHCTHDADIRTCYFRMLKVRSQGCLGVLGQANSHVRSALLQA